ncbi:Aste57867_23945 [Aphanomyces stellatus]|uniref:Aste57867_23945 protein n=1 Tax=Aphanomyces stellatus TaxID=120398 RepID=A0A485LPD1_9STRA|nr:hypothetical protein As57867_023872 [Aphanomyces stellatus]VFU00588.1 Aste57867_23945 [Aphanomyces stellatus]
MGLTLSCCLGAEDHGIPSPDTKSGRRSDRGVPSTPSMSDSLFYQSIGEHEFFDTPRSADSDSSFVESILAKHRTSTADFTPHSTASSSAFDDLLTPRTTTGPAYPSSTAMGAARQALPPTLAYCDDADDEGPTSTTSTTSSEASNGALTDDASPENNPGDTASSIADTESNNNDPCDEDAARLPPPMALQLKKAASDDNNNNDDEAAPPPPAGPFSVHVKRFFPIEDKFEFTVGIFDDELDVGRNFDIIRDRLQIAKFHDLLEAHAAKVGVTDCPALPYTKKQDRAGGRALMARYVDAIMQSAPLRDARITLKHFHVIEPGKKTSKRVPPPMLAMPSLQRHVSGGKKRVAASVSPAARTTPHMH